MNIGFVGAGIMGHGMAVNLLEDGHRLRVVAHRNRAPIDDLVTRGASEALTFEVLGHEADAIVLCLTGTHTVETVVEALCDHLAPGVLILDTTTNEPGGPERIAARLDAAGMRYVEAPVTGGAAQAREGVLGAIVGCRRSDFADAKAILSSFCKDIARFGEVGMGVRAKLVSNFLALGTAALVIESFKQARSLGVDAEKLYRLAQLGSGNSTGLQRIIGAALEGDYGGYRFSVANSAKDFSYFCRLAQANGEVPALAGVLDTLFADAVSAGHGERMISELLDPALVDGAANRGPPGDE